VRRKRNRADDADRNRLLWDAWAWMQLLDFRRRLGGGVLDGHWAAIDRTLREVLSDADLRTLQKIANGDVYGSANEHLVALAGPEPETDPAGVVGASIAELAGVRFDPQLGYTTEPAGGDGGTTVVPFRPLGKDQPED
jgi:hypothetical protein